MIIHLTETRTYSIMEWRYIYVYKKSVKAFCSERTYVNAPFRLAF